MGLLTQSPWGVLCGLRGKPRSGYLSFFHSLSCFPLPSRFSPSFAYFSPSSFPPHCPPSPPPPFIAHCLPSSLFPHLPPPFLSHSAPSFLTYLLHPPPFLSHSALLHPPSLLSSLPARLTFPPTLHPQHCRLLCEGDEEGSREGSRIHQE